MITVEADALVLIVLVIICKVNNALVKCDSNALIQCLSVYESMGRSIGHALSLNACCQRVETVSHMGPFRS